jgi:hypothetical protein
MISAHTGNQLPQKMNTSSGQSARPHLNHHRFPLFAHRAPFPKRLIFFESHEAGKLGKDSKCDVWITEAWFCNNFPNLNQSCYSKKLISNNFLKQLTILYKLTSFIDKNMISYHQCFFQLIQGRRKS